LLIFKKDAKASFFDSLIIKGLERRMLMTAFVETLHKLPIHLLINASFYLYCEKIDLEDFYPVWRRYLEVIE